MDKTYQPNIIETEATVLWESCHAFLPQGSGPAYSIMLPPPNITGSLHMGHGFQQTLMDVLIRYHRMKGYNTLWQPGTDHAGIATQMLVERQLEAEGKTRHDLGREAFIERVWSWKAESGGHIAKQMRRLGASADWSRDRFTLDEDLSLAVRKVFIDLYREGLIYRGKRLVNWDVKLQTAVSDLEVIPQEQPGSLWHIHYPFSDGREGLTVATTRPETLFGDVAVAVHPEDTRYQAYIGQQLQLPLCNRLIPIIADNTVEKDFGSGCVKITPAHDFNDYAMAERHALPLLTVIGLDGKMNASVPEIYQNLDRFEARKQVVAHLLELQLLIKTEDYRQKKPIGERSGTILEPLLTDQWFVKTKPLANPAITAVQEGKIRFIPDHAKNLYFEWMNHIQDWCISRQLWWGHRIPAWYDETGQVYVGENEAAVRAHYHLSAHHPLHQDQDVLDTWFSSALWPFSTLGWPTKTQEFKTFYPTSVLVTGFDIIFFWVARMIMLGLKCTHNIPFRDVYVHGLIRDHEGQKMSKSKGNVLDPVDLIDGISLDLLLKKRISHMMQPRLAEKIQKATRAEFPDGISAFGTDALRLTFCALATTSREICFDIARMSGYRNFCNKLWNAARFISMQIEQYPDLLKPYHDHASSHLIDRYLLSRLHDTLKSVEGAIAEYRFDWIVQSLYELVWNEYCDFSLECSKVIIQHQSFSTEEKVQTLGTLLHVLGYLLKALHPLIPFITESIWQSIKLASDPICLAQAAYPEPQEIPYDRVAIEQIEFFKRMIAALRALRAQINLEPKRIVNLIIVHADAAQQQFILDLLPFMQSLCKIDRVDFLDPASQPAASATCMLDQMIFCIPLAGVINHAKESERLQKQILIIQKEITRAAHKLSQDNFIQNAPPHIVLQEKEKLSLAEDALSKLHQQLKELQILK